MAQAQTLGSRAQKTRSAILHAAEELFAEKGFEATRLEDVASTVGIRRASLVYYFRDKREIYEAVLEEVLQDLRHRVEAALATEEPIMQRIEAAITAWVDFVCGRPTFARLLLREVADGSLGGDSPMRRFTQPYLEMIQKHVWSRPGFVPGSLGIDPLHTAATIAGSTVFFVAAIPQLVPAGEVEVKPTDPAWMRAHRDQMIRVVRGMIATSAQSGTSTGTGAGTPS